LTISLVAWWSGKQNRQAGSDSWVAGHVLSSDLVKSTWSNGYCCDAAYRQLL
jgi:hypothetical protein